MNTDTIIQAHLAAALEAARTSGAMILDAGKDKNMKVHSKNKNDFVTDTDRASEELIISIIKSHFPEDAIFGEETGASGDSWHGRWIIDPIDGTTNFFRSLPNYTVSIAWELEPFKPLVGVVYNPRQDELFWASKGYGAFLNGQPIHVSDVSDPTRALMVCVPPHREHDLAGTYFEKMQTIFEGSSDLRSFGSCALELAYLASGRLDGYYELCLGYYDLAAGMAILQEAGGAIQSAETDKPFTDKRCDLVASNGLIHPWILHIVQA